MEAASVAEGSAEPSRQSPIVRIVKDLWRYLPAATIPSLLAPLTAAIFTRTFSTADYGSYGLTFAVAIPATDALTQWLMQPTVRYYSEYHQAAHDTRWTALRSANLYDHAVSSAIVAIMVLVAVLGSLFLVVMNLGGFLGTNLFLWAGALAYVVMRVPLNVCQQVLRSALKSNSYLIATVANTVLAVVLPVAFVFGISHNVGWLAWGQAIASLLVVPYVMYRSGLGVQSLMGKISPEHVAILKRFAKYGIPMTVWWVGSTFLSIEDRYVIGIFKGTSQVGIYSVNYNFITGLGRFISAPMLLAFGPVLYNYWNRGLHGEVRHAIARVTDIYMFACFAFVGAVAVVGEGAAILFIGPHFRVGLFVLLPIAAGVGFWTLALVGHQTIALGEGTTAMATSSVVAGVFNLALNLAFVPLYGYRAAAYSTAVAYFVYVAFIWWQSRSFVHWDISIKTFFEAAVATVVAAATGLAASHLVGAGLEVRYLMGGVVYGLVFLGLTAALHPSWLRPAVRALRPI